MRKTGTNLIKKILFYIIFLLFLLGDFIEIDELNVDNSTQMYL